MTTPGRYGLVTFADESAAASAIDVFNGQEFQGRNLLVHEDRGATKGTDKRDEVDPHFTGTSVFVNNLSWNTTDDELRDFFMRYGATSANIALRKDGKSRGWGTVQFSSTDDANSALTMKGEEFCGRIIEVLIDKRA